jgi:hypothetical protein
MPFALAGSSLVRTSSLAGVLRAPTHKIFKRTTLAVRNASREDMFDYDIFVIGKFSLTRQIVGY